MAKFGKLEAYPTLVSATISAASRGGGAVALAETRNFEGESRIG